MAISGSGLLVATFVEAFTTGLSIDLTSDTDLKAALFTSSLANPNFTTDVGYGAAPYNANEASGAGYTAGGAVLTGTTSTGDSGVAPSGASDVPWPPSPLQDERRVLVYDQTQEADNVIVLVDLGQAHQTSNGSLVVQW